ncbi:unnamed protein product [Allacma fusca]|uniref:ABC transporter domain-containing protein n=1 Tax=Allacma fusca TaxID=39272 RepID=A0A8J2MGN9_9HEXA|nr:unnamed protein product [Allacma fusca]
MTTNKPSVPMADLSQDKMKEDLALQMQLQNAKSLSQFLRKMSAMSNGAGGDTNVVSYARKMLVSHLPHHPPVALEFNDLNFSIREPNRKYGGLGPYMSKQQKSILKDVSGIFKPGELTAIMGPSGAGKSTLMNILAGYKNYNVQVLEAMRYAAQLKLPRKTTKAQKELAITEILDIIGLTDCKDVKTSSVSGGQRKRLAIALELVNNPPVMFFDEPTSGLDSASCYSCVALLKALAQGGRTIIATIHQPSARIFEQFDSLYLLAEGKCLFRGPVRSLVPFMGRQGLQCPPYHNPADFAIEAASGDYGEQWIGMLAKATALSTDSESSGLANDCSGSENASEVVDASTLTSRKMSGFKLGDKDDKDAVVTLMPPMEPDEDTTGSLGSIDGDCRCGRFWNQFITLYKRSFICIMRDTMMTRIRFASVVLVGLLIGAIYHDAGSHATKCFNNAGNLFFGILFLVFSAMMSTLLTFPLERGVLIREHLNCWYSLKSYFFARTLADLPFQIFFPTLYVTITYFMTEQPLEFFRFSIVCGMLILVSLVAQSIGLLIGAACAIQSTLTAVYGYDRGNLLCSDPYCHFKNPKKFLETLDAVDISVTEQATILLTILIVLRFLTYWALRLRIMAERI